MNEELMQEVKRHIDYTNAMKQKSYRDLQVEQLYNYIIDLQQQLKEKDEKIQWILNYNKECSKQLLIEDEKIRKCIEIIINDTTLNPQRQRDRLINILESNKED